MTMLKPNLKKTRNRDQKNLLGRIVKKTAAVDSIKPHPKKREGTLSKRKDK